MVNSINIVGLSTIGIFLFFIFMKKQKQKADYALIFLNCIFASYLFSNIWISYGLTEVNFIFHNFAPFLLFPAFITYALLLISGNQKIPKKAGWVFSLVIAFAIFLVIDFTVLSDYNAELLQHRFENGNIFYQFFFKGNNLFSIFGLVWFLKKLQRYQIKIKDLYSNIEPIELNWLKRFSYIFLVLNTFSLLAFLLYNFGIIKDIEMAYLLVNGMLVLAIFYLTYNGVQQYAVASFLTYNSQLEQEKSTESAVESAEVEKYRTSSLTENDLESIFKKLKELFEEEELFVESQLKVQTVADKLNISSHHLSQTINSKTGKPFYEFVNFYRVDHQHFVSKQVRHFASLAVFGFVAKSVYLLNNR